MASMVAQPVYHDTPITNAIGSSDSNDTSTAEVTTHEPPRPPSLRAGWRRLAGAVATAGAGKVSGIT
ncbi:hypothetical protein GCM10009103_32680 [Pseudomonas koreensis]|nr:hypothetical protein GCM10009103_32680 [Pseudomonas koreensis]